MGKIAYNLFLLLYRSGLSLIRRWNPKARLWLEGRKGLFEKIQAHFNTAPPGPVIWMHCASLGEFEQGRPLLEKLRDRYPGHRIVLTFFSASGYEVRKNYQGADLVCYLPADSRDNAKRFVSILQPKLVLWVKYEYWYYYLQELKNRGIPVLLLSGFFFKEQTFFKWYGHFYRRMLYAFRHIFVQDERSRSLLGTLGFGENISVSGDTRFDRVIEIAEQFSDIQVIAAFCADAKVVVAGSTWREDEEELDHFAHSNPDVKFIIAPHEITAPRLAEVTSLFRQTVLFSALKKENLKSPPPGANVLIIDNIGMLSRLYHYATIAFIGGGFGNDGIHNILEAAVYGKPVIFGPVYDKFKEATELIDRGGAFSVENALELEALLSKLLKEPDFYQQACESSRAYVYSNKGATDMIMQYVENERLLT